MKYDNYSNSVLNRRSQGVQVFLANAYFMCQMFMNKAITGPELLATQVHLLNAVGPLIEKEIPLLYQDTAAVTSQFKPIDYKAIQAAVAKPSSGNDVVPDVVTEGGDKEGT